MKKVRGDPNPQKGRVSGQNDQENREGAQSQKWDALRVPRKGENAEDKHPNRRPSWEEKGKGREKLSPRVQQIWEVTLQGKMCLEEQGTELRRRWPRGMILGQQQPRQRKGGVWHRCSLTVALKDLSLAKEVARPGAAEGRKHRPTTEGDAAPWK